MSALFRSLAALALPLACACIATTSAQASTIYTYTGGPFTNVTPSGPSVPPDPYTTDDRVTGVIEMDDPLLPNLPSLTTILPATFSFSDGVNTITNANATSALFRVATDGDGRIVAWNVILNIYAPQAGGGVVQGITLLNNGGSFWGDIADDTLCDSSSTALGCSVEVLPSYSQSAVAANSTGVWERQTPQVPEPTSLLLIGAALAGVAARRRLR